MTRCIRILVACIPAMFCGEVTAYEQATHEVMSQYALEHSIVNDPAVGILTALGLGSNVSDNSNPAFLLPSSISTPFLPIRLTPDTLVSLGAHDEDNGLRSLNHFYDPQQGGIALSGVPLTDYPSPKWALAPVGSINNSFYDQTSSYQDAKAYFLSALTSSSKTTRDQNLGLVFETLGHVIHHLQDMSQPQHVRDDSHCDAKKFTFSILGYELTIPGGCKDILAYNPSKYEEYVATLGADLPLAGYPTPDYGTFNSPLSFWTNSPGRGNAEFTSFNFVSAGTNFHFASATTPGPIQTDGIHALPAGASATLTDRNINDLDVLGPMSPTQPLAGDVSFVQTPINDSYNSAFSGSNPRASSLSIFYTDLVQAAADGVVIPAYPYYAFTLNRLNYQVAANILLPRAVAYSTGLINYFFRGQMEITLPSNGVYAFVDDAVNNGGGVGAAGFTKLKLKLRNSTQPGISPPPSNNTVQQEMSGGTLQVIAKYHVNPCYTPDLLGDYAELQDGSNTIIPPQNCSWAQYASTEEQISTSAVLQNQSLSRTTAQELTFDFTANPIPINAHDLTIQVLYHGALGQESDGIAIGFKNISEPTYVTYLNNTDYFSLNSQYVPAVNAWAQIQSNPSLCPPCTQAYVLPVSSQSFSLYINGTQIAGPTNFPIDGYVRVAFLADPGTPVAITDISTLSGETLGGTLDVTPAVVTIFSPPFSVQARGSFRGIRGDQIEALYKADTNPSPPPSELQRISSSPLTDNGPTPIPILFQ